MKKLINLNLFDENSNFSKHLYSYRTIVRKIRKKYEKIKTLIKRQCIQLKIEINDKKIKMLLNNENKINFINRVIIKQLNLFFFINKKACNITNTKLKIFKFIFLSSQLSIKTIINAFSNFFF